MATQTEIDNLIKLYLKARDRLLNTVINAKGVGTKTYANTVLKQVQAELDALQRASTRFVNVAIPAEYQKNLDAMYQYYNKNGLLMSKSFQFASVHREAVYQIGREMQFQISQGLATVGRQVQRYLDTARDEALRTIGLTAAGEKLAGAATVGAMKHNMMRLLQQNGFMTIQYGDFPGRQVKLDVYARMVARSTSREAANAARLNTMDQLGYDLVHVSEHSPTCDVCAAFQGRVYSVSGNDKRFPCLYDLPGFKDGYRNFHPNCRHVIMPTVESLWTDEQRAKYLGEGNKPAAADPRTQKQVDKYNKAQGENRKAREALNEYEQYKLRLGADAPATFDDWQKLKAAGGQAWDEMSRDFRMTGVSDLYKKIPKTQRGIISEANLTDMLRPMDEVYRRYPGAFDGMEKIVFEKAAPNTYAAHSFSPAKPNNSFVNFNTVKYNNIDNVKRDYLADLSFNFHPAGTDWTSSGVHELGHRLELSYWLKKNGLQNATTLDTNWAVELREDWVKRKETVNDILNRAYKNGKFKGTTLAKERAALSGYSATSPHETIAEAVADFFANGSKARPFSTEIIKILDEVLLK